MPPRSNAYAQPAWQRELSSLMDRAPVELTAWAITVIATVGMNAVSVW